MNISISNASFQSLPMERKIIVLSNKIRSNHISSNIHFHKIKIRSLTMKLGCSSQPLFRDLNHIFFQYEDHRQECSKLIKTSKNLQYITHFFLHEFYLPEAKFGYNLFNFLKTEWNANELLLLKSVSPQYVNEILNHKYFISLRPRTI